jgi:hypothetical protein
LANLRIVSSRLVELVLCMSSNLRMSVDRRRRDRGEPGVEDGFSGRLDDAARLDADLARLREASALVVDHGDGTAVVEHDALVGPDAATAETPLRAAMVIGMRGTAAGGSRICAVLQATTPIMRRVSSQ